MKKKSFRALLSVLCTLALFIGFLPSAQAAKEHGET